jgi:hypothetical protein
MEVVSAAEAYRLAQAEELMVRFEQSHARPAESEAELSAWAREQVDPGLVTPSQEALDRVAQRYKVLE